MNLRVSSAPLIKSGETTKRIMLDVIIALVPCVLAGVYRFGLNAAILLVISALTAVLCEFIVCRLLKQPQTINDLSALVTGLILGLNLPATAPWWIAVIGSAFAILLIKLLFGGIGDNFLNPAMAARAVLLASWPVRMTSYILPLNSFFSSAVDATSSATPLATGSASLWNLFIGNIPGTIGEVSTLMILLGFAYLVIRKVITPVIPCVMVASTFLFTLLFGGNAVYAVLAGGLMFGAVFMATDYTTSPMTVAGQVIYAASAGLMVVIVRKYGAYPEGVTFGILLMNIVTPLIDKFVKPTLFGKPKKAKGEV